MLVSPSSKPSARIEHWLLDLQQYRFTVEYRPGVSNPADYFEGIRKRDLSQKLKIKAYADKSVM